MKTQIVVLTLSLVTCLAHAEWYEAMESSTRDYAVTYNANRETVKVKDSIASMSETEIRDRFQTTTDSSPRALWQSEAGISAQPVVMDSPGVASEQLPTGPQRDESFLQAIPMPQAPPAPVVDIQPISLATPPSSS